MDSRRPLGLALLFAVASCGNAPGAGVTNHGGKAAPGLQLTERYFPDGAPWYQDVSSAPVSSESAAITAWMVQHSPPLGWGSGTMRVDFSIPAVEVPAGTAKVAQQPVAGYYAHPDCDTANVPLPPGGAVEQSYGSATVFTGDFSGYACAGFDKGDDCHLLLVAREERRLYEVYHGTINAGDAGGQLQAGCLAVWDMSMTGPDGRGQQCTSADAAGFPIAPLLFTPEEIQAGRIDHAIRFILPNDMIRQRKYVAPATHGTKTTGPAQSGPYGFRMRLRADYPVSGLSPAAQVVARALQRYGMLLADGGTIALTAQSDILSDVKWADVGFDSHSLTALSAADFEVIDFATPTDVTFDCQRTQITQ